MTRNLAYSDLEDAIAERLEESSLLESRTFAVVSPFLDVNELPAPPVVLVMVNGEQRRTEGNAIGVPLVMKTDVAVHVMIVASWLRARGDAIGAHELLAEMKDLLVGWQPANDVLPDVKRPLVLESSALYDTDEERRLLFWLVEFSTMILVREPS